MLLAQPSSGVSDVRPGVGPSRIGTDVESRYTNWEHLEKHIAKAYGINLSRKEFCLICSGGAGTGGGAGPGGCLSVACADATSPLPFQ